MARRTIKAKKKPKKGRDWFDLKVAELKTEIEKLPPDRQEQLAKDLEEGKEH